jgi:hypothetical protein
MTYHDFGYLAPYAQDVFDEKDILNKFSLIEFIKKSHK